MNVMEDLKAYVDGELSPARRSEIEAAMEQDERMRQELEEIRVLSRLIGDCVVEPEPVGLEQTLRLLEARRPRPIWLRLIREPLRFGWVWAMAGFILLAIFFPTFQQAKYAAKSDYAKTMGAAATGSVPAESAPTNSPGAIDGDVGGAAPAGGGGSSRGVEGERIGRPEAQRQFKGVDPSLPENRTNGSREMPRSNGGFGQDGTLATTNGKADVHGKPYLKKGERPPGAPEPVGQPLLIRTGDLTVRVANVQSAEAAATVVAKGLGGYVEASSAASDESNVPQGAMTLRVPEQRFELAMTRLRGLGAVTADSTSGQDVTAQVADTEARLKVMRAEEESYVTMLRAARHVTDLLEIKDRLSQVREQIESLDAQRKALRNQATYSTISLTLTQTAEKPKPPTQPSWFDQAWDGAKDRASALGRWFAEVGMNLLVLAPIWVTVVGVLWWFGRRRGMKG